MLSLSSASLCQRGIRKLGMCKAWQGRATEIKKKRKPRRNEEKMAKKNYAAMADGVIKAVGGEGNIANVTHCMTRLRLQLVDASKLDEDGQKRFRAF